MYKHNIRSIQLLNTRSIGV